MTFMVSGDVIDKIEFEEELEFVVNCAEAGIDEYSCGDERKEEMSRVEKFKKRCLDKKRVKKIRDFVAELKRECPADELTMLQSYLSTILEAFEELGL